MLKKELTNTMKKKKEYILNSNFKEASKCKEKENLIMN